MWIRDRLSGDNERERERFAGLFGNAAKLHFNQGPLHKLGFIRDLQKAGRRVLMAGDGLNDAAHYLGRKGHAADLRIEGAVAANPYLALGLAAGLGLLVGVMTRR